MLRAHEGLLGLVLTLALAPSCERPASDPAPAPPSPATAPPRQPPNADADLAYALTRLRRAHQTTVFGEADPDPAPAPPKDVFDRVHYPTPLGDNVAYVTPPSPTDPRPAIVWIAGGFDWGIGQGAWSTPERNNDQTARAFREAGIVLMLPSLRGSNGNPGRNECFLGEVDDILAAGRFLATRPDVDPQRIYLGGHSTGGTLALLAAASTDLFAAVFAFGPVADPRGYGDMGCLPTTIDDTEARLRSPIAFLDQIRTSTVVIEGMGGNTSSFGPLEAARGEAPVQLLAVPGADHFDVLAPVTEVIARAILEDRDLSRPGAVSLAEATAAVHGPKGAVLPQAERMVRAMRWPAIFRRVFDTSIDQGCRARKVDLSVCAPMHDVFSEAVLRARLAVGVSRSVPPEAIDQAIEFYESDTGLAVVRALTDPDAPQPSPTQMQQFEQYRASNAAFEGPQGEAMAAPIVEDYIEHVFD